MKLISFVLIFLTSSVAFAQIKGAVGFESPNKAQKAEPVVMAGSPQAAKPREASAQKENAKETKESKMAHYKEQQKQWLHQNLEKSSTFKDVEAAKTLYASLKQHQQAIDAQHKRVLDKQKYNSQADRDKAMQELKENALVNFGDFKDDAQTVNKSLNNDPMQGIEDLSNGIDFIATDKIANKDRQKQLSSDIQAVFQYENDNMTVDEYMAQYNKELIENNKAIRARQSAEQAEELKNVKIEEKSPDYTDKSGANASAEAAVNKVSESAAVFKF